MPPAVVYTFGPFTFSSSTLRLFRDQVEVVIGDAPARLLHAFLRRSGVVLTKEQLFEAGWGVAVVEDNTLARAILRLRRALDADPEKYIATVKGRGYRFVADVTHAAERHTVADFTALAAPYRALLDGRAALETLDEAKRLAAEAMFEKAVAAVPDEPSFHVGLANACLLRYDRTRDDEYPDAGALERADRHSGEACALNNRHGEAYATRGVVLDRLGDPVQGAAMLRYAVSLEPGIWLHRIRLAWMSWGPDLRTAVREANALVPSPFGHLLVARVEIACGDLARAEQEIDAGIAARDRHAAAPSRYAVVGLDMAKGLLCYARDAEDDAMAAWAREFPNESSGHIYGRRTAALAHASMGGCLWHRGDAAGARDAFARAIRCVPRLPLARAGMAILGDGEPWSRPALAQNDVAARLHADVAIAQAAVLQARGNGPAGAALVHAALAAAVPGDAGWMLPVDPLLRVWKAAETWRDALELLRTRAR